MYNIYNTTRCQKHPLNISVKSEIIFKQLLQLKQGEHHTLLRFSLLLDWLRVCRMCRGCLDLSHNGRQLLGQVSRGWPLPGVLVPTALHQPPALGGELGEVLRPKASFDWIPKMLLVATLTEVLRQLLLVGAYVPVQDTKGVDIDRWIVIAWKELRSHVYWCANHSVGHHRFWFAKPEVG